MGDDDRAGARTRQALAGAALLLLVSGLVTACDRDDGPEARIRALLVAAEDAAEAREIDVLTEAVSEHYADAAGRDRQAVKGILVFYFLRHTSIHLLTRHHEIALGEPGHARAVVFVAMAGTPFAGIGDLPGVRADLYRFAFDLADEDGTWRVVHADWRRAAPDDFL
jgi:hypothetical protein